MAGTIFPGSEAQEGGQEENLTFLTTSPMTMGKPSSMVRLMGWRTQET
jgi:hypothetical protein